MDVVYFPGDIVCLKSDKDKIGVVEYCFRDGEMMIWVNDDPIETTTSYVAGVPISIDAMFRIPQFIHRTPTSDYFQHIDRSFFDAEIGKKCKIWVAFNGKELDEVYMNFRSEVHGRYLHQLQQVYYIFSGKHLDMSSVLRLFDEKRMLREVLKR